MFGLYNNLFGRWYHYPCLTEEALIRYAQDAHVKLNSCFALTLATIKSDTVYILWA